MDTRGLIVGTSMMLSQAALFLPNTSTAATEITSESGTNQIITTTITRSVNNIFDLSDNYWTESKKLASKAWAQLTSSYKTEDIINASKTVDKTRLGINGLLSFSSGNTEISIVKEGLRLWYSSSDLKVEVRNNLVKLQFDFSNNGGVLKMEMRDNSSSIKYTLPF